ncbi:MAG: hypothetical protein ACK5V3_07965, partial [Bdellovibrionales bacterium]
LMICLILLAGLGLTGCAKKKTADKTQTQREAINQQKKEQLLAEARKLEAEKLKAEQAASTAKAEAEAAAKAEADKEAQKKKQEEQAAKPQIETEDEMLIPRSMGEPPPVGDIKSPVTTQASSTLKSREPEKLARQPSVPAQTGTANTAGVAGASGGTGTGSAELDAKVKKAGSEKLQKLTDQAQAAEKSDMKNIKPGSPEADWAEVINYVTENGKSDEVAGGMELYLSVDEFSSNNFNEPYNRKMISLVGGRDSRGTFGFSRIHAVDEDWSKDKEGNNVGLLYQFLLGRDGSLAKVSYVKLVKKASGSEQVVEHRGLDLTEAEGKARWEANRQHWVKKVVRNK